MTKITDTETDKLLNEILIATQKGIQSGKISVSDMPETKHMLQLTIYEYLAEQQKTTKNELIKQYQQTVAQTLENLTKENTNDFDQMKQHNHQLQAENQKVEHQIFKKQQQLETMQKQVEKNIKDDHAAGTIKFIGEIILSLTSLFILIFIGTMFWKNGLASIWHWINISGLSWLSTFKVFGGTLLSALVIGLGITLGLFPYFIVDWLKNKHEERHNRYNHY